MAGKGLGISVKLDMRQYKKIMNRLKALPVEVQQDLNGPTGQLRRCADMYARQVRTNILSGRRYGMVYPALDPDYAKWKKENVGHKRFWMLTRTTVASIAVVRGNMAGQWFSGIMRNDPQGMSSTGVSWRRPMGGGPKGKWAYASNAAKMLEQSGTQGSTTFIGNMGTRPSGKPIRKQQHPARPIFKPTWDIDIEDKCILFLTNWHTRKVPRLWR
jgi:hypothetical protein